MQIMVKSDDVHAQQQHTAMQVSNANLSDESSDDSSADWQQVPTTSRKRTNSRSPQTFIPKRQHIDDGPSTSNRFARLSRDDVNTDTAPAPQPPKPPPIFIPDVEDIGKMLKDISKVISANEYNYKALRDRQVRLNIKSIESYRKLVKYLDSNKKMFHTYQLKQERAFTAVIKGLHHSTPLQDIKAKLLISGHDVRSVRNIKSRKNNEPLPMFFVDIDPKQNNKDIFELRSFENAVIKVEQPRKIEDIVQCYRCQEFGHTKSYCRKPYRCVKCGQGHSTSLCSKTFDQPPLCVHCGNNHTANYRGCQVYQNLINKRSTRTNRDSDTNRVPLNYPINNHVNPNQQMGSLSYSEAVRGTDSNINNVLHKIEAMLSKQIELTNTLMNMMSMLMAKLCN